MQSLVSRLGVALQRKKNYSFERSDEIASFFCLRVFRELFQELIFDSDIRKARTKILSTATARVLINSAAARPNPTFQ